MKILRTIDITGSIGIQIEMSRAESECLLEDLLGGTMGLVGWELKEQLEALEEQRESTVRLCKT